MYAAFTVQLNGSRKVVGVLRGYDPFMNLVLDEAVEVVSATERSSLGMIVRPCRTGAMPRLTLSDPTCAYAACCVACLCGGCGYGSLCRC